MRVNNLIFAGLDLETTGSDYNKHGICQLGFFTPDFQYSIDINPGDVEIQEEALQVNKFTKERISNGMYYTTVDDRLVEDFHFVERDRHIIAIGWNVGSFDVPFIKKFLPKFHKMLSYRTVDLNAICFTINPAKMEKTKKLAKKYAEIKIGETNWHDALYDAKAAYWAWEYLREAVA